MTARWTKIFSLDWSARLLKQAVKGFSRP